MESSRIGGLGFIRPRTPGVKTDVEGSMPKKSLPFRGRVLLGICILSPVRKMRLEYIVELFVSNLIELGRQPIRFRNQFQCGQTETCFCSSTSSEFLRGLYLPARIYTMSVAEVQQDSSAATFLRRREKHEVKRETRLG